MYLPNEADIIKDFTVACKKARPGGNYDDLAALLEYNEAMVFTFSRVDDYGQYAVRIVSGGFDGVLVVFTEKLAKLVMAQSRLALRSWVGVATLRFLGAIGRDGTEWGYIYNMWLYERISATDFLFKVVDLSKYKESVVQQLAELKMSRIEKIIC